MPSLKVFRELALSFPGVIELPHFDKSSFRVNKKIFVTLNEKEQRCCVRLSPIDQSVFCAFDPSIIYPVPNKWGKQGWTLINLGKIKKVMLKDALSQAYAFVSRKPNAQ